MAKLSGAVSISGLPPHRGLMVNLAFFKVDSAQSPPPFDGDPPAEHVVDCVEIFDQVDLNTEVTRDVRELPFLVERELGFYYIQIRAILFRKQQERAFA